MNKKIIITFLLLKSISSWAGCKAENTSFQLIDPIDQKPWQIVAKAYRPETKLNSKFPVVFVLPTIIGETILERKLAQSLCRRGMGASQGGMISTFIAGSEPLIKSSVVIVAGGNVSAILAYSDQKGV